MSIPLANHEYVRGLVVVASLKPVNDAGRDSLRTKHHRHGRGEILTMTFPNIEQKIGEGLVASGFLLECVPQLRLQIRLDRPCGIEPASRIPGDLRRKFDDARIEVFG